MMQYINLVLFVMAALAALAVIYRQLAGGPAAELVLKDRACNVLLLIATVTAVLVRSLYFGAVPGGFNQDGAMAAVDALALATHGTDRFGMSWPVHLTAWGYGQMSALMSYLMVPFIKLLGFSEISVRLPLLIISLLGLWAMYAFCRDVFGKSLAVLILAFGAICPWHILQSRWALDCNLYPHFFVFGIYFLNKSLRGSRKKLCLSAAMLMFGLCMYCYGVAIYTMPVFLLLSCIYLLWRKKVDVGDVILAVVIWLAVSGPFILCMAINFFGWETVYIGRLTIPFFPESVRSGDILFFSDNILEQLKVNIRSLLEVSVFQGEDLLWNNMPSYGSVYKFSMPITALGLLSLFERVEREEERDGRALLLFFLLTGIFVGICTNEVNINRANIIFYPILMLTGLGLAQLPRWLRSKKVLLLAAIAYALVFGNFARSYFTHYNQDISYTFDEDYGQAITALENTEAEKYYISTDIRGSSSPKCCEIYTMFYHAVDAEYFQGKTVDENGLSYGEKYIYTDYEEALPAVEKDAAYLLGLNELELFYPEGFSCRQYGEYCVLEAEQ